MHEMNNGARRLRLVVTGLEGQVVRSLAARGALHADIEFVPLGRPELDLADTGTIVGSLIDAKPDAIVSAAAYTAVDLAEQEVETARKINALAPGEIGRAAAMLGVPVVHLSTDYVFDGSKPSPYVETDPVAPLGVYGRTKLDGEIALAAATEDYVILRTAWVYSPYGRNFLKTMLRIAATRETLSVVGDQVGNPTSALDIADAVISIIRSLLSSRDHSLRGIFHMSGSGQASWAEFAAEILAQSRGAGGPFAEIVPIATSEYPTPACRPANSRLDCTKLEELHGIRLPHWKTSMNAIVGQVLDDLPD